ncbi:hypothetical protein [Natronobiforma cellulositropha]|uniref:hypothetical protein n=1 Tax=Natronobiforma cellulositropha TaxID=1679076 RepID=UPI0021D5C891|nr:hypothetical protein [Natronobiforma cellulositropha]
MSSPPTTHDRQSTSAQEVPGDRHADDDSLERIAPRVAGPVRVAGFWSAIVLPFLYVPLLATGLSSAAETLAFLGLLALNVLALYVGHSHLN